MENVDYDKKISDFIKEWETDKDDYSRMIKRAVTGFMVPLIYKNIREVIFLEKPIPRKKDGALIKRCFELLHESIWYILWIIKWIIFNHRLTGKDVVLTSFFRPFNNNTLKILQVQNHKIFVNYSIIYNLNLLLAPVFLCYPHFLYKYLYTVASDPEFEKRFMKLFHKYFSIKFNYRFEFVSSLNRVINIYNSFHSLLHKINKFNSIPYLVQDCDYLAERVIFAGICNEHNIITISVDHSIILKDHLFQDCNSKIVFAWGDYQRDRINRLSRYKPARVIISGKKEISKLRTDKQKRTLTWIYFLPAFQEAHIQSVYRSLDDSLKRIDELVDIIKIKYNDQIDFWIKPHPSDQRRILPLSLNLIKAPLKKLLNIANLAFVEDSTISLELLSSRFPVIYFADRLNNDPLAIKKLSIGYVFAHHRANLSEVLMEIPKSYSLRKREKMYDYYFGSPDQCHELAFNQMLK